MEIGGYGEVVEGRMIGEQAWSGESMKIVDIGHGRVSKFAINYYYWNFMRFKKSNKLVNYQDYSYSAHPPQSVAAPGGTPNPTVNQLSVLFNFGLGDDVIRSFFIGFV